MRTRTISLLACAAIAAGLGACGSDAPDASGSPAPRVAALGDSLSAGFPLWDPDPSKRAAIEAPDARGQYEYWAERQLGNGISFRNCGVSGDTSDGIRKRLDACVRGAQAVVIQGGGNDIALGTKVDVIAKNLRATVESAKRKRLRVMLGEMIPQNASYPETVAAIRALNRRIREIGREEKVRVLPWYQTLEDPKRPGRIKKGLTNDGIHPSIDGHRRLARTIRLSDVDPR